MAIKCALISYSDPDKTSFWTMNQAGGPPRRRVDLNLRTPKPVGSQHISLGTFSRLGGGQDP